MAKTIGLSAIPNNISGVIKSPYDNPKKISAPFKASSRLIGSISLAYFCCNWDSAGLFFVKSPLLLNIRIFSNFTPNKTLWHKQLHIFEVPFYYIEYGIAQLGAIAVWRNYTQNKAKAI